MKKVSVEDFGELTRYSYEAGLEYVNDCDGSYVDVSREERIIPNKGRYFVVVFRGVTNGVKGHKLDIDNFNVCKSEASVSLVLAKLQVFAEKSGLPPVFVTDEKMCSAIMKYRPDVISNDMAEPRFPVPNLMGSAVDALSLTQDKLGKEIGMSRVQVGLIARGNAPLQLQTELALECLLRRAGKWINDNVVK
jgi:DNA-binding XRE family transcriptional regulator